MNGARDPIVPMDRVAMDIVRRYHRRATVRDIVSRVAFEMGLKSDEIISDRRQRPLVRARMAVVWVARLGLKRERSVICTATNLKEAAVDYNFREAQVHRDYDPAFRMLTDKLLAELSGEM